MQSDDEVFEKQSEPHRLAQAKLRRSTAGDTKHAAANSLCECQFIIVPSNERAANVAIARSTEVSSLTDSRWKIKKWILSRRCEKT